jgi:DNA invertase Pin-like site-specific DNA recombinase
MTPHVADEATQLYADGLSVAANGQRLEIDASTVHKALKKPA